MIEIFYTKYCNSLDEAHFNALLKDIPVTWRPSVLKYKQAQDRQASLLGRLLLLDALRYFESDPDLVASLNYINDRPFFNNLSWDFNISHSEGLVVCAICKQHKIGIDTEKIRPINIRYYHKTMSPAQWKEIKNSIAAEIAFWKYWTMKESIVKEDGCGILIPIKDIKLIGNTAFLNDKRWYVHEVYLDKDYITSVACREALQVSLQQVHIV